MPLDLQALAHDPKAKVAAAGGVGVVALALVMKSRATKKAPAGINVVPPANPPTSTADISQALNGLNQATTALTQATAAASQVAAPVGTPGVAGAPWTPPPGWTIHDPEMGGAPGPDVPTQIRLMTPAAPPVVRPAATLTTGEGG